jgi:TolB-like protein/DNA-binding winged helix-turn-helix (wHTH) protein
MPAEAEARTLHVDLSRYELRLDGQTLRLEKQPMELLIHLVQRKGQLVTRDDIAERLWGREVFVDVDNSINAAVRKIRMALKDDSARPHFLETVVGKGYRFVGDVELVPEARALPEARARLEAFRESGTPETGTPPPSAPRRLRVLPVAGSLLLLTVVAGWAWSRRSARIEPGRAASIAVLPLANLSGDPAQDYLADGLTEELTTDLAKVSSLRVISRTSATSYKGSSATLQQIARELKVDVVVEGSVQRAGNQVRITAQLIDAGSDRHLWADSYDRDLGDVLAVQNTVALEITRQVHARLILAEQLRLEQHRPADPAAIDAFLRGRYSQTTQSINALRDGLPAFQQAIAIDPKFAPAYAGLADSYSLLVNYRALSPREAFPLAMEAARKALALDPDLPAAHVALAYAEQHYTWEWDAAGKEYETALSLSPSDSTARLRHAEYLSGLARHDEAIAEIRRAEDLDPLSPVYASNAGRVLYNARRYDEAVQELDKALKLDPTRLYVRMFLAMCYEEMGRYVEAEQQLDVVKAGFGGQPSIALAHLYAATGRSGEARQVLQGLRSEAGDSDWFFLSGVYAALGDKDRAFECLQQACDKRDFFLGSAKVSPYMDPLRADPRYAAFLHRIGLS